MKLMSSTTHENPFSFIVIIIVCINPTTKLFLKMVADKIQRLQTKWSEGGVG